MKHARLVAEVSSNHNRDLDRCLRFVDAAAGVGCDAIKFQQFKIRELFAPEALATKPELLAREAWELPESFNAELAQRSHERGIAFSSTPFYRSAVDLLEPLVDFFKLASYQLLWHELLSAVARTKKPIVLATGMADMDEVRAAVDVLRTGGCEDLTLLHCVSQYPTPADQANLAAIGTLREAFGTNVGWSDHTVDAEVVARAVRRHGATMIEFHFDLDGGGAEYGGGHCWLPGEVEALVAQLDWGNALPVHHPADGDGGKQPRDIEAVERLWRTDPIDGLRPLRSIRNKLTWVGAA